MRVILFVGHHKVGSSALQSYLARNAVSLLRQGVLYPAVEAQGLSTLLDMAMRDGIPTAPLPVNLREAHNALAFSMIADQTGRPVPALHQGLPATDDMFLTIMRQVEVFEPKVIILAAEVFANFAAISPELIARLRDVFPGAEISLTATLRRVDDYLVSWHAQRLRFGQTLRPLPQGAFKRYCGTIHFDYRKMLEGWIKELPNAPLRLRSYDEVIASGGSEQDFMSAYGLPLPTDPALAPRMNKGLHRGLIEIARQMNMMLEPDVAGENFQTLLRLGSKLDLPRSSDIEMFGLQTRALMAERFAPIHAWLSELADPAGVPFFADISEIGSLRPYHEHEVNRMALAQIRKSHLRKFPRSARAALETLELSPHFD